MKQIKFSVTDDLRAALKLAARPGRSESSIIRQALYSFPEITRHLPKDEREASTE